MDQSYSDSDLSLSPSQILERLQVLRQLQLLQRGKLQKQRLQYQETSENSSNITEVVSHFSNSTSYNTFRSLLQSSHDISKDSTPRQITSDVSPKVKELDLIDGVAVLNLSQESEFIVTTPLNNSKEAALSRTEVVRSEDASHKSSGISIKNMAPLSKKKISLDEMPILSPRNDFEALIIEKLQEDKSLPKPKSLPEIEKLPTQNKKPFLRRGEGMTRFGLKKNDLIIQNTKSLPWKQNNYNNKKVQSPIKSFRKKINKKDDIEIIVTEDSPLQINTKIQRKAKSSDILGKQNNEIGNDMEAQQFKDIQKRESFDSQNKLKAVNNPVQKAIEMPIGKNSLQVDKGKTWASVLTKEQNDFLRQLKQSDYYKNFTSPAKSIVSDVSCDGILSKFSHEREIAEQNMFDLLENKVSHESFNIENSFINRFLRKSKLECSGESTPLVMQRCLTDNPDLIHLIPNIKHRDRNRTSQSDVETCHSEYTDCCSDDCSTVISCCSCKTVETTNNSTKHYSKQNNKKQKVAGKRNKLNSNKEVDKASNNEETQHDTVTEDNVMQTNMVEMNAKLITTSDLLKERLNELEDEIETFRKENLNLTKLREEVDHERQKFYEEKSAFEQKFNEDKILSEYYLAEEKEKLTKQKQMYERYVREMRGRLNKKDKDEVVHLKKEINDLKEEIRLKDAKSTTTTARLRNQLKIMEKEKKDLQDQVEKLKKENRRIQHSNDMTRRLTNIKYLAEINKKLTNMTSKDTQSEIKLDSDIKYKAYEIERQSRSRKSELASKSTMRRRAKSVPNLKVTSRYAKYFSQRDAISSIERNKTLNVEGLDLNSCASDDDVGNDNESLNLDNSDFLHDKVTLDNEDENHLEKLYLETFQSESPKSNTSSSLNTYSNRNSDNQDFNDNPIANGFFIRKSSSNSNSVRSSKSPQHSSISPHLSHSNGSLLNRSKSPISILINKSNGHKSPITSLNSAEFVSNLSGHSNNSYNRSKSPITSNQTSQRSATVILKDNYRHKLMVVSPEPSTSKTSLAKTSMNPTEIRKPDGTKELRFPNGNIKYISADGTYSKFVYYNGDVKENFFSEGRIKYFYAETKTYHTTHADGLEVFEFPDGQVEKRYKDGSSEIRLPNGSARYFDPKNKHVREEWRFPDGAALTVAANGEQRIVFNNGQVEVHAIDHKRREFPDGTVKLVYNDGTSETRYSSGRVRIKDKHGNLIMDSASG